MGDDDGEGMLALEGTQVGEQSGDVAGAIFVEAMQAHEGVEQKERGPMPAYGLGEAVLVALEVEPDGGSKDDVDGQMGEVEAALTSDAREASLDDGERVLGHVDESAARLLHLEGAEAGRTARDRQSDVEAERTLAASCRVPSYAACADG
jgi:hypothetical protein